MCRDDVFITGVFGHEEKIIKDNQHVERIYLKSRILSFILLRCREL
jgi:hypothetical protein